jgi:hypothetical protein
MAAGDVVRLVLAAEPFEVIVGAIAEGLARLVDAEAAWLLGVGADGTTNRLAAWDPPDLAGISAVRRALEGAPSSVLGEPGRFRQEKGEQNHRRVRPGEDPTRFVAAADVDADDVRFVGCVASSRAGRFPEDVQSTMATCLHLARSAIVAARAAAEVHRLAEGQAALRRIAAVAAAGEPPETVFGTVTAEVSVLLGGALVALTRFERGGAEAVVLAQTGGHVAVGVRLQVTGDTTLARMRRSGRAERIDGYAGGSGTELIDDEPTTLVRYEGGRTFLGLAHRNGPARSG